MSILLIDISEASISFGSKLCFAEFSAKVYAGDRIALIGDNGAGKTQLLNLLAEKSEPKTGRITRKIGLSIGYVSQTVEDFSENSGSERFNKALSAALKDHPDILILDEPTNHLDVDNRRSLLRMLERFNGAIIFASHDEELLSRLAETVWHINNKQMSIFNGSYPSYTAHLEQERLSQLAEFEQVKLERKRAHISLMKEQEQSKKSRAAGKKAIKNHKMPPIAAGIMKSASENSRGRKASELKERREDIKERLAALAPLQERKPKFILPSNFNKSKTILHIINGCVGWNGKALISGIEITLAAGSRLVLAGRNATGKSTLAKAIAGFTNLRISGEWITPPPELIGCLDQHYASLEGEKTVFENVSSISNYPAAQIRTHLNDFLFSTDNDINCKANSLSCGEKARLSLAIAAVTPKTLLILDEITNNIDIKTKRYITALLKEFPAALILISHEHDFIEDVCGDARLTFSLES
ncbi:MAG: ATP-binding cassette domain-containing protein [Deferribacteraceae bacterium]|nr:ATP-binding cassette domain-containing protein [Deferribacteraceae bacterium]